MAIKVPLRKKSSTNERSSLFLDFYPAIINEKGELKRREFLKMYKQDPINYKNKNLLKRTLKKTEVQSENPIIGSIALQNAIK